ncbi:DnaJ-domain-containing protein [Coniophora puteana RWD-64-598 SS2]|uniref:DnaJ-domain-containing protein n=1 Tax=Coniophora puteana (strain RWD-64-598) TaxID=741705 RepID=A0A5M3MMC0_CONPW|nr:DnaJ-domain-containing protein [Coniophora puteana RWD-64-598 SS2]EIW79835.1 DnaJ-domain-containing protein [Coniophora puteana RWD-64-598 SS2]
MAAISLPALPASWNPPSDPSSSISSLNERKLIPAGRAYLHHVQRTVHDLSFDAHDAHVEEERKRHAELNGDGLNGEDDLGVGEEEEPFELLQQDPKEWKKQDHYQVLGLSHLRYKATPDQIKVAHRKKVLKHHPDKKAGQSHTTNDDGFFKCIQKAHEVLTNAERRRQFDSVDPELLAEEEDDPSSSQYQKLLKTKKDAGAEQTLFFKTFVPIFEREARFSKKQPVPMLGQYEDGKAAVEGFYNFWYDFDSWRSFEYLDKEVNEGSDSRDDKRYTEKKNKSERARRKKDDTARLRNLVDLAMNVDPRIKRIRQEEKEAREAKKKAANQKVGGPAKKTKAEEEAEKKKAEEEKKAKEEEEKAARAEAKKAKAAAANAAKKARRAQRAGEEGADAS